MIQSNLSRLYSTSSFAATDSVRGKTPRLIKSKSRWTNARRAPDGHDRRWRRNQAYSICSIHRERWQRDGVDFRVMWLQENVLETDSEGPLCSSRKKRFNDCDELYQLSEAMMTADAAKQRILCQPHLAMQRLWCQFDRGRLFLRGQVPSFYFKQLAQEAVVGMEGVRQVVNEIEVVW